MIGCLRGFTIVQLAKIYVTKEYGVPGPGVRHFSVPKKSVPPIQKPKIVLAALFQKPKKVLAPSFKEPKEVLTSFFKK